MSELKKLESKYSAKKLHASQHDQENCLQCN